MLSSLMTKRNTSNDASFFYFLGVNINISQSDNIHLSWNVGPRLQFVISIGSSSTILSCSGTLYNHIIGLSALEIDPKSKTTFSNMKLATIHILWV